MQKVKINGQEFEFEKLFFQSDDHHGHGNILRLGRGRPFDNVEEMTETLIKNHNDVVGPNDLVVRLGDFCFWKAQRAATVLTRYNGQQILVEGNHDGPSTKSPTRELWKMVCHYAEFEIKDDGEGRDGKTWRFCCQHFPQLSWHWSYRGSIMVHGHSHSQNLVRDTRLLKCDCGKQHVVDRKVRRFDVGVDANEFKPVSAESLIDLAKTIPINDSHEY